MTRTTQEVLDDHLDLSSQRRFDEDIERNFASDCVVLTSRGAFHGRAGLRELAGSLADELPKGDWVYETTLVAGRMAFLHWTVEGGGLRIEDGADSFLVEDGKVVVQTIHYTVRDQTGALRVDARGHVRGGPTGTPG